MELGFLGSFHLSNFNYGWLKLACNSFGPISFSQSYNLLVLHIASLCTVCRYWEQLDV